MAIKFNGSTGYLEMGSKVVSAFPFSMFCWVSFDSVPGDILYFQQQQSNADRRAGMYQDGNASSKYASFRNPGGGQIATSTHGTVGATLQPSLVVFASTTSRTVYFASGDAGGSNTGSVTDDTTSHDRVTIGAAHYNSGAASNFLNGSVAEAHFFNTALTSGDFTTLCGDYTPESMSGWVDGWTLKDYQAGGSYVSIGGTHTLTANGSVVASGQPHPITRTAATTAPPPKRGGASFKNLFAM